MNYLHHAIYKCDSMTLGDYNIYRGWIIPPDEDPSTPGFLVISHDRETWISAEHFLKTHTPYETPIDRVAFEAGTVDKDLTALRRMLLYNRPNFIPHSGWVLLHRQEIAMDTYRNILKDRMIEMKSGRSDHAVKGMRFSEALEFILRDFRVARVGWNGKGMWVAASNLGSAVVDADKFWSKHSREHAEKNGGTAVVPPAMIFKNAKGEIQMGWAPSQEDMFADDWVVNIPE